MYSEEEKAQFRNDPKKLIDHIKFTEDQLNRAWPSFFKDSEPQKELRAEISQRMAELIKDPYLLQGTLFVVLIYMPSKTVLYTDNHGSSLGFTPKFAVGCRRVTPGESYLKAIQEPNVNVHFTAVDKVTPTGVIGADGILREGDTLICATGFDVSFRPRFPIIGRGGVNLRDKWAKESLAYMGLTVPDMPNLVMMPGPPTPVQNGTPFGAFHATANYALQIIKKMQMDNIRSFEPKRDVTEAFRKHCGEYHRHTVYTDACNSWYKNKASELVTTVWPGSAVQFLEIIKMPRWEHYNMDYRNPANIFTFMGNGLVEAIVSPDKDPSYYLDAHNIDPLWIESYQHSK